MKKNPFRRRWLLITGLLALAAGCYTVPQTGRKSLMLVSPGQEMQLGLQAFNEIKQKEKISTDASINARVRRVGERIAEVAGPDLPNAQWEYVVFDAPDTINAFALPGGKIGVYTGLLKVATTDDELAVVMGHELAHATARHGAERMSQGLAVSAVGLAGAVAMEMKDIDPGTRNLILGAYGVGTTVGVLLPYSRLNESEADEIGLIYSARAGYDPRASVRFWQKMSEANAGRGKPPEFLSTHPSDQTRIQRLQALMPKVLPYYEAARRE